MKVTQTIDMGDGVIAAYQIPGTSIRPIYLSPQKYSIVAKPIQRTSKKRWQGFTIKVTLINRLARQIIWRKKVVRTQLRGLVGYQTCLTIGIFNLTRQARTRKPYTGSTTSTIASRTLSQNRLLLRQHPHHLNHSQPHLQRQRQPQPQ